MATKRERRLAASESWRTSPEQDAACRRAIAARVGRAEHLGGVLDVDAARELCDILGIAP